ncbi:hypothetical protein FKM82_010423 [Ascaphus truei]
MDLTCSSIWLRCNGTVGSLHPSHLGCMVSQLLLHLTLFVRPALLEQINERTRMDANKIFCYGIHDNEEEENDEKNYTHSTYPQKHQLMGDDLPRLYIIIFVK